MPAPSLYFGSTPSTGQGDPSVLSLPRHQDPRPPAPPPQSPPPSRSRAYSISPPLLKVDSIAPFFLPSYHIEPTLHLSPEEKNTLRLHDLRRCIVSLRLLGYDLPPNTYLTDPAGRDMPCLVLFHHFTDPNERLLVLIATLDGLVRQLGWLLREAKQSADVGTRVWEREIYGGAFKVLWRLQDLVELVGREM